MDDAARELAERCWPHVPTALLAYLWRAGEPFPAHTVERGTLTPADVLVESPWAAELIADGQYVRFDCPDCGSLMFQPYTDRGIWHALKVARSHQPDCCAERKAEYDRTRLPAVWPDRVDE